MQPSRKARNEIFLETLLFFKHASIHFGNIVTEEIDYKICFMKAIFKKVFPIQLHAEGRILCLELRGKIAV